MLCQFDSVALRCPRCGFVAKELPHYRNCQTIEEMARDHLEQWARGRVQIPPLRLGSLIAAGLMYVGVTEERVKTIVGKDCGCQKRKSKLDDFGAGVTRVVQGTLNLALNATAPVKITETDVAVLAKSIAISPLTNRGLKDKAAGK